MGTRTIQCQKCKKRETASEKKYSRKKSTTETVLDTFNSPMEDFFELIFVGFGWLLSEKKWRCNNCGSTDIKFID